MPGTDFDLMGEAREPDTLQDSIKDRIRVRGNGSTSWKRYAEDNRNKGRRGEVEVAGPRIQHGQILHFEVTSRINEDFIEKNTEKNYYSRL